jgi:hypothetical protein
MAKKNFARKHPVITGGAIIVVVIATIIFVPPLFTSGKHNANIGFGTPAVVFQLPGAPFSAGISDSGPLNLVTCAMDYGIFPGNYKLDPSITTLGAISFSTYAADAQLFVAANPAYNVSDVQFAYVISGSIALTAFVSQTAVTLLTTAGFLDTTGTTTITGYVAATAYSINMLSDANGSTWKASTYKAATSNVTFLVNAYDSQNLNSIPTYSSPFSASLMSGAGIMVHYNQTVNSTESFTINGITGTPFNTTSVYYPLSTLPAGFSTISSIYSKHGMGGLDAAQQNVLKSVGVTDITLQRVDYAGNYVELARAP